VSAKLLYRSVYLDIEGMVFTSLDELNTAIHISLLDFNEKPMAGRDMSRRDMFLRGEKDFLRPLPEKPFVMKECKLMTVGKNCYVSLFKHHYSVPREHVGKRVVILYDADTVEIYCGLKPRGDARQMRHPIIHTQWKEGTQSARSLRSLTTGDLEELLPTCCGDGQHRLDYLREVDGRNAVPAKILQQLPWDTVAREKIRNRPAHSGMRMRIAEI